MLHYFFNVSQVATFECQHIITVGEVGVGCVWCFVVNHRFVDSSGQDINHVDIAGEFAMFFTSNRARHKDAKVTDAFMDRINNGLTMGQNFAVALIKICNPAQRLWWWRDVVALGAKHNDG